MRSHTRYHLVYGTTGPRPTGAVGSAAAASAGEAGIEMGTGSGAAAKSAKSTSTSLAPQYVRMKSRRKLPVSSDSSGFWLLPTAFLRKSMVLCCGRRDQLNAPGYRCAQQQSLKNVRLRRVGRSHFRGGWASLESWGDSSPLRLPLLTAVRSESGPRCAKPHRAVLRASILCR